MTLVEFAMKLRPLIEKAAASLEDADALEAASLFPFWSAKEHYEVGDRCRYDRVLYKCLQAHDAQETWTPADAPSLWAKVLIPDPDVIPEWEQPDSTNPYMTGDKVMYNGKVYRSLIDNNIWSPEAYPAGWEEVVE